MGKLERGELALSPQAFSPAAALREVLRSCAFGLQRGAAGLRWVNEAEADTALPPLVEADLSHLSAITMNLVTNAIKFSHGSEVRVTARLEDASMMVPPYPPLAGPDESTMAKVLRIEVADAGAGLAAEDCERIFRAFERAAPEKGGGTGLGLHISRAFARAMGGDVTVASQVGAGSTCESCEH